MWKEKQPRLHSHLSKYNRSFFLFHPKPEMRPCSQTLIRWKRIWIWLKISIFLAAFYFHMTVDISNSAVDCEWKHPIQLICYIFTTSFFHILRLVTLFTGHCFSSVCLCWQVRFAAALGSVGSPPVIFCLRITAGFSSVVPTVPPVLCWMVKWF